MADKLKEEPFSYQATQDGLVFLFYNGRKIKNVAGVAGSKFLTKMETASPEQAQHLMARITGHFKH